VTGTSRRCFISFRSIHSTLATTTTWGHAGQAPTSFVRLPKILERVHTPASQLSNLRQPTYTFPSRSTMISVLLLVFLLQLTIHLINTLGAQTINDLVQHFLTFKGY